MRPFVAIAAVLCVTGCGGGETASDAGPTVADAALTDAPPRPDLRAQLSARGFTVSEGDAFAFGLADCAALPDCFGSNATGSYLFFSVPPAPGAEAVAAPEVNPPRTPDKQSVMWRLGANEAVLVYGRTPPVARYFSVAPYLFQRRDGDRMATVFASVADATNQANVGTVAAGPFDADVAFLIVSHADVEARAREALAAAGWSPGAVNTIVLSPAVLRLGTHAEADTVMALGRVALFADPAAGARYLADVPLEVLRLTGPPADPTRALPQPPRAPRVSVGMEGRYAAALDALGAAIEASLGAAPHTNLTMVSARLMAEALAPSTCIASLKNCAGEVSDTVYASGPAEVMLGGTLTLGAAPAEYFLAYGVNHAAAGMAVYSNFVVSNWGKRAGVAAVDSTNMVGSADRYLPDHPDRDKLFVVKVTRACGGEPYCLEIGTGFPGVPLDTSITFTGRAYLSPGRAVSPNPLALLTERVVHVGR